MKVRIEKNKQTGDISIDYNKVRDKAAYRCRLLKAAVEAADGDITVYVDTRIRIGECLDQEFMRCFDHNNAQFLCKTTDLKAKKFFGINVNSIIKEKRKTVEEFEMVFEVSPDFFSEDAFGKYLINMDIAVGIGRRRSFEEVSDAFFENADAVMFNADWFDNYFYDAVGCAMLRSRFDISETVRNLKL
jgi:hypothetical protein